MQSFKWMAFFIGMSVTASAYGAPSDVNCKNIAGDTFKNVDCSKLAAGAQKTQCEVAQKAAASAPAAVVK
jgi:hypothetical protein